MLLTLLWKVIFVHLNTTPIYQEYIHLFIVLVFMLLSCSQFILLSHFRIKACKQTGKKCLYISIVKIECNNIQ